MKVERLQSGRIGENTYLFACGAYLTVIDPGADAAMILAAAEELGKSIRWVLLTHAHFDHMESVKSLQECGAMVYLHEMDLKILPQAFLHGVPAFKPDILLKGGENLDLDGTTVAVLHTPGHTAGSACYLADGNLFTGDTLFLGDVGRCDLPSGCFETLKRSLKELFLTGQNWRILPGHGESTTMERERAHNPYVRF